jgi:squalene cyclase
MRRTEGCFVTIAGGVQRWIEPGMYARTRLPDLPGLYRVRWLNHSSVRLVIVEPKWSDDGTRRVPGLGLSVAYTAITHVQKGAD